MYDESVFISIDTNVIDDFFHYPIILNEQVEFFELKENMSVKVYMENEIWDAIVILRNDNIQGKYWCAKIIGESQTLTDEQYRYLVRGHYTGLCVGSYSQKIKIASTMLAKQYSIENVKKIVDLNYNKLIELRDICYHKK